MSKILWVLQILLAIGFFMFGIMKITTPYDQLATQMPWVLDISFLLIAKDAGAELHRNCGSCWCSWSRSTRSDAYLAVAHSSGSGSLGS